MDRKITLLHPSYSFHVQDVIVLNQLLLLLHYILFLQVAAGLLPPPKPIPQNTSTGPSVRRIDPSTEEREANEKKKERQDHLEDVDDAEALSKARAFDDFKDEHRRGSGNRMNRS
ncbi:unnamed protein product [Trichobilharzia regenti]|nr:unnamed protein product [Trichobilharzia regenti]